MILRFFWRWSVSPSSIVAPLALAVATLITHYPALQIGFWFDDYNLLQLAGRPSWGEFASWVTDPAKQKLWFRPMPELQWRIEYFLLGDNPFGYHLFQNLLHLANCILLYLVIQRLTGSWRAGFVGALIYSTLPLYQLAVFWLATQDALAGFFCLLTILLWASYLQSGGRVKLVLAWWMCLAAMGSKEVTHFLPIALLLIDFWVIRSPKHWRQVFVRNLPFLCLLVFFLWIDLSLIATRLGTMQSRAGWESVVLNMLQYVSMVAFPWDIELPARFVVLVVLAGLIFYNLIRRRFGLPVLAGIALLSLAPMASPDGVGVRYLYLPLMSFAAGVGILAEFVIRWLGGLSRDRRPLLLGAMGLIVSIVFLWNSSATADAALNFGGTVRQTRLQFSPIFQQHKSFGPDTYLYFIEPPFAGYNVSGLMFLKYGNNVTTGANDYEAYANLRPHQSAFIFYRDEENRFREEPVAPVATAMAVPEFPARFGSVLLLEGFEVVSTRVKPNHSIIVLLYWRVLGKIDTDYMVFGHLTTVDGKIIVGQDGPTRRGTFPTSAWKPGSLVVDSIILPVTADVPAGSNYALVFGLYDLATMARLPVFDNNGNSAGDSVMFQPFSVEP